MQIQKLHIPHTMYFGASSTCITHKQKNTHILHTVTKRHTYTIRFINGVWHNASIVEIKLITM